MEYECEIFNKYITNNFPHRLISGSVKMMPKRERED